MTLKTNSIQIALKQLMNETSTRQIDIANKTGLSRSYISMVLSGLKNPELDTLRKICSVFNISLGTFFLKVSECEIDNSKHNANFKEAYKILSKIDNLISKYEEEKLTSN